MSTRTDRINDYITLAFSPDSELVKLYPENLMERRKCAAEQAGLTEYEDIIEGADEKVNQKIILHIYNLNNPIWTIICTTQQAFNEYQSLIFSPIKVDSDTDPEKTLKAANLKSKLMEESDKMLDRLEKYWAKLFGDNNDMKDIAQKGRLTPETILNVLSKK